MPENATAFEKNVAVFKKKFESLFEYLELIPGSEYLRIYSKKDIPVDCLMNIFRSLQVKGIEK
jgi:hypothetical protein